MGPVRPRTARREGQCPHRRGWRRRVVESAMGTMRSRRRTCARHTRRRMRVRPRNSECGNVPTQCTRGAVCRLFV